MHPSDHDVLHLILVRLDATTAAEIELADTEGRAPSRTLYRARCGDKWTYVDRTLAIRLRENGAVWSGEVLRDPVTVA